MCRMISRCFSQYGAEPLHRLMTSWSRCMSHEYSFLAAIVTTLSPSPGKRTGKRFIRARRRFARETEVYTRIPSLSVSGFEPSLKRALPKVLDTCPIKLL
jgi:hypothetical protein